MNIEETESAIPNIECSRDMSKTSQAKFNRALRNAIYGTFTEFIHAETIVHMMRKRCPNLLLDRDIEAVRKNHVAKILLKIQAELLQEPEKFQGDDSDLAEFYDDYSIIIGLEIELMRVCMKYENVKMEKERIESKLENQIKETEKLAKNNKKLYVLLKETQKENISLKWTNYTINSQLRASTSKTTIDEFCTHCQPEAMLTTQRQFVCDLDDALENFLDQAEIKSTDKSWQDLLVFISFSDLEKTLKVWISKKLDINCFGALKRNFLIPQILIPFPCVIPEMLTPLMAASLNRSSKTLARLLEANANVNAANDLGDTALIYLCQESKSIQHWFKNTCNQMISQSRESISCLTNLIQAGAEMDGTGNKGMTALMHCALNGNAKFIKILVEKVTNMKMQSQDGRTALMYASCCLEEESATCASYLLTDSDLNAVDNVGNTALLHSILNKNVHVFGVLLKSQVDIDVQNKDGFSPLMVAVEQDLGEFVGDLLKLNPQLKLQNKDGDTALILAAKKYAQKYGHVRNSDILEAMIMVSDVGFDIINNEGKSAMMIIIESDAAEINLVQKMTENGADLNVTDLKGRTALQYARSNTSTLVRDEIQSIIKFILQYNKRQISN
ncbi:ankyrin repeat domain-containing protein 17 [Biomphalaria glabrata]|nr:ankyrin repeat domain-containing protein 17-like [Biomphalaria glabrata]KAI8776112.1 ankyrin repeat domain-containing protein 17 [Biomphalaria glabrata]